MTRVESFVFSNEITAPAAARRFVSEVLTRWGFPHLIVNTQLLVSELVTNSVRHARTDGTLVIRRRGDSIRVETTDSGQGPPEIQHPGPDEPSGRGLAIVARVAPRWGVERRADLHGKTVWFELDPT